VLNDGTLTVKSLLILHTLFPGISIPDVRTNDREVDDFLARRGLDRCRDWRRRFVFFRKLVDPVMLAQSSKIMLLDSDCLHFRVPVEIRAWAHDAREIRYIADVNRHSYCAPTSELSEISGALLPEYFCAGYLCLPRSLVDLSRIERYLAAECFERQRATGQFAHVAEQTLYAMEASVIGTAILPTEYATCPDPHTQGPVMGHFCGGSYQRTWFYTKGLPIVRQLVQPVAT